MPPPRLNTSRYAGVLARRTRWHHVDYSVRLPRTYRCALSRAAFGAFVRAAREIQEHGIFRFAEDALPYAEANALVTNR